MVLFLGHPSGNETWRSLTSVKCAFASTEKDNRRSTERRWTSCCGVFTGRLMMPELKDRKLGHVHGKRMAGQKANGSGSAGSLWGL